MKLLNEYFKLQKEIYDYFGYKEDWVVIPIDDASSLSEKSISSYSDGILKLIRAQNLDQMHHLI